MDASSILPLNLISQNLLLSSQSSKKYLPLTADTLKCGSCRTEFLLSDIVYFIQHKATSSCKTINNILENDDENSLTCSTCPESFKNAKSLLEHAQFTHKIKIFVESPQSNDDNHNSNSNNQNSNTKTNEIFIDFVPSDKHSDGQSYNITVSSNNNENKKESNKKSIENNSKNNLNEQEFNSNTEAQSQLAENEDTISEKQNNDLKRKRKPISKEFLCEICNAKFNQKIHLTKHSAKHTGIKPFKCTECNYSTVERSHLKVHIRIHTGEKPFKCSYCEYATAQSSTLKIHTKRHHNENSSSLVTINQNSSLINSHITTSNTSTISNCGGDNDDLEDSNHEYSHNYDNDDGESQSTVDDANNRLVIEESKQINDESNKDEKYQRKKRKRPDEEDNESKSETNKLLGLAEIALEHNNK